MGKLHVPPAGVAVLGIVAPGHALAGPVMADGKGLTVTIFVDLQAVKLV